MTLTRKGTPPAGGALLELSLPDGNDLQANSTRQRPAQAISCSPRAARRPVEAWRDAALTRLRRQRLVAHLHRLGPAPLSYFLREVEAGASIADHLEVYGRIDPQFVEDLAGRDFVPFLHAIDGGLP